MKVFKPLDKIPTTGLNVFLAGSIEMGKAVDWQQEITDKLSSHPIQILNPRRDDWDSSWEQSIKNTQFFNQVSWELKAMEQADLILMYFAPETKSPISLLEFGMYSQKNKLIVCCPDGFWRKGNVDVVCERYGVPQVNNIEELAQRCVEYVKQHNGGIS